MAGPTFTRIEGAVACSAGARASLPACALWAAPEIQIGLASAGGKQATTLSSPHPNHRNRCATVGVVDDAGHRRGSFK